MFGFIRFLASVMGVAMALSQGLPASAARPSIEVRTRSAATAAAYAITDDGMPPAGTYSSSAPLGFNNTGQIYGIAARKAKADPTVGHIDQSCLLWTGSKYVDLAPSLIVTSCTPYGINSASPAAGSYTVVGSFTDDHHGAPDAFAVHVDSSGTSKLAPYYDHFPAALYGVNNSGTALGYSNLDTDYKLFPGPMFVTAPPELMNILQAGCVKEKSFCLEPLQLLRPSFHLDGEPLPQCPFGGCTINDGGNVLGVGYNIGFGSSYGSYAVYSIGSSSLDDLRTSLGIGPNYLVSINDANRILFFQQTYLAPLNVPVSANVYDIATGNVTTIPPVAGTSCQHYFPISMNDAGEVLGFTSYCTRKAFYWTWDPVHGTQNLSAAIPVNAYSIKPLGVNDNAQILVSLQTAAGVTHWGTLDPLAPAAGARPGGLKKARDAR